MSKLKSRIHALCTFQYKPYKSIRTHLTLFRDLTVKIDDEIETNVILNHHGRLPNYIPDANAIYDYLLSSIWNLPVLHDKVRTWELERKPEIFDAAYVRTKKDLEKLEENMIKAEKLVFPNGILQKRDCRDKTRNNGSQAAFNYRYFAPYARVTPRRLRWQRNENRRARIRYSQFGRFRQFVQNTGCHACGRSNHKIKDCRDKEKRDSWCRLNKACYFCCATSHRVRDCVLRKNARKTREEEVPQIIQIPEMVMKTQIVLESMVEEELGELDEVEMEVVPIILQIVVVDEVMEIQLEDMEVIEEEEPEEEEEEIETTIEEEELDTVMEEEEPDIIQEEETEVTIDSDTEEVMEDEEEEIDSFCKMMVEDKCYKIETT